MELYRIKKWGNRPETYVIKNWSTEIDNQGRLRYFVYGKGYQKTKAFELVDIDIDTEKKDALYIGEIFTKYGHDVATEVCEHAFGCCTMSAQTWTYLFRDAYKTAIENFTENEVAKISREVVNLFRPMSPFTFLDTCTLDKFLTENDSEYDGFACTYKGKSNVSMKQYLTEKYGKITAKFVEKMIG